MPRMRRASSEDLDAEIPVQSKHWEKSEKGIHPLRVRRMHDGVVQRFGGGAACLPPKGMGGALLATPDLSGVKSCQKVKGMTEMSKDERVSGRGVRSLPIGKFLQNGNMENKMNPGTKEAIVEGLGVVLAWLLAILCAFLGCFAFD